MWSRYKKIWEVSTLLILLMIIGCKKMPNSPEEKESLVKQLKTAKTVDNKAVQNDFRLFSSLNEFQITSEKVGISAIPSNVYAYADNYAPYIFIDQDCNYRPSDWRFDNDYDEWNNPAHYNPYPQYVYYVHIVPYGSGYAFEYWFYYPYNDGAVNTHYHDWEHITVFVPVLGQKPDKIAVHHHFDKHLYAWDELYPTQSFYNPVIVVINDGHGSYAVDENGYVQICDAFWTDYAAKAGGTWGPFELISPWSDVYYIGFQNSDPVSGPSPDKYGWLDKWNLWKGNDPDAPTPTSDFFPRLAYFEPPEFSWTYNDYVGEGQYDEYFFTPGINNNRDNPRLVFELTMPPNVDFDLIVITPRGEWIYNSSPAVYSLLTSNNDTMLASYSGWYGYPKEYVWVGYKTGVDDGTWTVRVYAYSGSGNYTLKYKEFELDPVSYLNGDLEVPWKRDEWKKPYGLNVSKAFLSFSRGFKTNGKYIKNKTALEILRVPQFMKPEKER